MPLGPRVHARSGGTRAAPDAGEDYAAEDYAALAKTFPTPPATAGIVYDGDEGRLSEEAFLRDFAGDIPPERDRAIDPPGQWAHLGLSGLFAFRPL